MGVTNDCGVPKERQFRVIEQYGNWFLLYDQHVLGSRAVHEFRIVHVKNLIALHPGATLAEAKARFKELSLSP